eukprot:CAMPEP_0119357022 /NCGR_PEP_ID=MMETSP1334-20130426/5490_1 /TAXON_ID=127549 /ORGANISM="Calcidiscus leptoporus, Strain RCC1130" /LENGTH=184 /DNA_ID=CAMNT_0007371173 /DNA_START=329 /DNA_END=883 /DNA_ORIENTATION=-
MSRLSQLPGLRDEDGQLGLAIGANGDVLNLPHREHAIDHLPEDNVLAIQPVARIACDEELATICIWPRVGHGHQARARVFQRQVLVLKLLAIDAHAASAVSLDEITALAHETLDHAMEGRPLKANGFAHLTKLSGAKLPEILSCARRRLCKKLYCNAASIVPSDGNVHEHDRIAIIEARDRSHP